MRAWLRDFFKSEPTRHREHVGELVDAIRRQNVKFIRDAETVGFTEEQARLLQLYFSFSNHRHEYKRDVWDRVTGEPIE